MGNWLDKKYVAIFVVALFGTAVLGSVLMKIKPGTLALFSSRKSPAASSTSSPGLSASEKAKLDEFKALEQHLKNKPGHGDRPRVR